MAWSAPTEWERWDPEKLLDCPYDKQHRIPAKRYQYHVIKCRENYPEKDFVSCPFNAKHIMLRPELRRHISRCQDRGEIEPYSFKGNEKDIEGFYFKGDTSVPCYRREAVSRPQEEDWDREDEETTTQQNLCDYYASRASLPPPDREGIQDVLSLNPTDREEFKRNIRTQAIQNQYPWYTQQNLSEQRGFVDSSSVSHWNHCEGQELGRERNENINGGRMVPQVSGHPGTNNYSQKQWPSCSNNGFVDEPSTMHVSGKHTESNSKKNGEFYGFLNQKLTHNAQGKHWIPENKDMETRFHHNGFSSQLHKPLGASYSTIYGKAYPHQIGSHGNVGMDNNEHGSGVIRPEMRGVITNTTKRPGLSRGAGRAKLAEEARRMNFGFSSDCGLKRSGAPIGRGRGILDLFSSNDQG